ncbi:hypothetical protein EMPG_16384 [Blastomyces silverae]|uniref:Uncharacterized protein n=1 Tax=Blastomyces silverae TaxID=2060906 RepID=A0A0H1B9N1_9EURO|nr:hypothetical protein EMPG_16384 [Blastomyces silverae]
MRITLSTGDDNNENSTSALKEFKNEHDHVSLLLNEKLAEVLNFKMFKYEVMIRVVLLKVNIILTKYEKHDKNHILIYNLDDLINELIQLKTVIKKDMRKGMQFKKNKNKTKKSEKEGLQSSNISTTQNSKKLNISQNTNSSTS